MSKPDLVPASHFDSAALAALFTRAYEGYFVPIQLDAVAFEAMTHAGDIALDASFVARCDGQLTGVGILGVRGARGWVGGMGVVPERRGRGDGRALMNALIGAARDRGITRLGLEVLIQNAPAIPLYESLGFKHVRLLDVLSRPADVAAPAVANSPTASPSDASRPLRAIAELPLTDALPMVARWQATPAPWQRESRSIERSPAGLEAIALKESGPPVACVIYRMRGTMLNLGAVCAGEPDRVSRLEALMDALLVRHAGCGLQIINLPEGDPAGGVLRARGARLAQQQHEMILEIGPRG